MQNDKSTKLLEILRYQLEECEEFDSDTVIAKIGDFEIVAAASPEGMSSSSSSSTSGPCVFLGVKFAHYDHEVSVPIDQIVKFHKAKEEYPEEWKELKKTVELMIYYVEPSLHAFVFLS